MDEIETVYWWSHGSFRADFRKKLVRRVSTTVVPNGFSLGNTNLFQSILTGSLS
jgi:hypothetical protein